MNVSKLTLGLAAIGAVSLASVAQAEEKLSSVMTAVSGTTISGWVDTSLNWRPGTGVGFSGGPIAGTTYGRGNDGTTAQDGFNLNVVGINIDKAVDADQAWGAGYHVQLAVGPDAVAYRAAAGAGTVALSEAYVTLHAPLGNGIDFKIGRFATPIGYEVFESYKNPNYGRSFGFNAEPTVHEGVLATYTFSKEVSVSAGIANTFDNVSQGRVAGPTGGITETKKTYIFAGTLTAPESLGFLKGSTLSVGYIVGNMSAAVTAPGTTTQHIYVGSTLATPVAGLNFGAAYDYHEDDINGASPTVSSAYAVYASYAASDKLKLNARGEYALVGNQAIRTVPANRNSIGVWSATLTADYSLWKNVVSRAEVRWDSLENSRLYGTPAAGSSVPFVAGDEKNLITLALNVIYVF